MSVVANVAINVDARGAAAQLRQFQSQSQATQRAAEGLQGATRQAGTSAQRMGQQMNDAGHGVSNLGGSFNQLRNVIAGISFVALIQQSTKAAASYNDLQTRLRLLTAEYGEQAQAQQFAADAAKRFGLSNREATAGVADIYARLRPLGISLKDIQSTFSGFNTIARLSGVSAEGASAAFLQLGQALGSGRLQGDEFRSIAEQVPGLLVAVSKETGIATSQLKQFASDGKLTSDVIINALKRVEKEGSGKLSNLVAESDTQKFKDLQNALDDLSITVGNELLPALSPVIKEVTKIIQGIAALPDPVKKAISGVVFFAAQLLLLQKGIAAVVNMRAAITGMLGATAASATAAGNASATAATKVGALRGALVGLLKLSLITLAVDVVINGLGKLAELQTRINAIAGSGTKQFAESVGGSALSRQEVEKLKTENRAERKRREQELSSVRFPLLTGQDEVARAAITQLDARFAKLQTMGERARFATPAQREAAISSARVPTPITDTKPGAANAARATGPSTAAQIAQALQGALDITPAQAAGIVGNLMRESGLDPRINEGGSVGMPRGIGGYGLAQWTGPRQTNLVRFAGGGAQAGDLQTQLRFMVQELMGPESKALESLRRAQSPEEAARVFERDFERSGIKALKERQANARKVFEELEGGPAAGLQDFARQLELQKQQLKTADQQNASLRNQLAILQETDPARRALLEYEIKQADIARQYNELKANAKSTDELALINANQVIEQRIAQIDYEQRINEIIEERAQLMRDLVSSVMMPTVYNELEQQEAALQDVINKYPVLGAAADAAAGLVTSGVRDMIAGTKSAEQVFVDFLSTIADALIDTARQMIAQYIAIAIARMFAGLGGGQSGMNFTPISSLPSAGLGSAAPISFTPFAEGGFVTRPTNALIGEAGEAEYVIPASKMRGAMERYANGARGDSVISGAGGGSTATTATNSGPLVVEVRAQMERINSVDYVTAEQFQAGIRQAAQQGAAQGEQRTLKRLQHSPATRRRVGV